MYSTTCKNCTQPSESPSSFYELELPMGQSTSLEECIEDLLMVEYMQENNKYFCSRCNAHHDAERCVVLKQLPDTLNLQLMR